MRQCVGWPAVLLLALASLPAAAQPETEAPAPESFRLGLPVDCVVGESCMVQNHVDMARGSEAQDFACGPLSYNGHKGTDFRVPTLADMRAGVAVLAAAAGRVQRTRDGQPDDGSSTRGTECGNGVLIRHGDGWETQYCHMLQGSISVVPGQQVESGTPLGRIGLSGRSEFPHLHFEVRRRGLAIDPFTGRHAHRGCDGPAEPLWQDAVRTAIGYRPGGLLEAGFADRVPSLQSAGRGGLAVRQLAPDAPFLVIYGYFFGIRAEDELELSVTAPDGSPLVNSVDSPDRDKAVWLSYAGRRMPPDGWPAGRYRAALRLRRDGAVFVETMREVEVR